MDEKKLIEELKRTRQLVRELNGNLSELGSMKATDEILRQVFERESDLEFTVQIKAIPCEGIIHVIIDVEKTTSNEMEELSIHAVLRKVILKNLSN